MRATKQKEKEEVGGEEEEVSRGARGQLIVSGNVFHLHVYTVNSGEQGGGGWGCPQHAIHCCHSHTGWRLLCTSRQSRRRKKERTERKSSAVRYFL